MKYISTFSLLFLALSLISQSDIDALRYSSLQAAVTARSAAIGGATGALGGDLNSITSNPAGLGVYRQSALVLSPSFYSINTESTFDGKQQEAIANNFNFNSIGIVFNSLNEGSNWKTSNFAMGYNRLANFNQEFNFEGTSNGSLADVFLSYANQCACPSSELYSYQDALAFQTGLIKSINDYSYSGYTGVNDKIYKFQDVKTSGAYDEVTFSMGGSYKYKLYWGMTLGIPLLTYKENKIYTEENKENTLATYQGMQYDENLRTDGVGFNLKLGVIYRIKKLRMGLAIHTPTILSLTDRYSTTLFADLSIPQTQNEASADESTFEYSLRTPFKAIGSVAYFIKKSGFISLDIEWLNHGSSKFTFDTETFPEDEAFQNELNNKVNLKYKSAFNIRLGGEWRLLKHYGLRIGYALYDSAFRSQITTANAAKHLLSTGIGLRKDVFFVDLSYIKSLTESEYLPYAIQESVPIVINKLSTDKFMLTLGFQF